MNEEQKIFNLLSELEARLYYLNDDEPKLYIDEAHKQVTEVLKNWSAYTGCVNE